MLRDGKNTRAEQDDLDDALRAFRRASFDDEFDASDAPTTAVEGGRRRRGASTSRERRRLGRWATRRGLDGGLALGKAGRGGFLRNRRTRGPGARATAADWSTSSLLNAWRRLRLRPCRRRRGRIRGGGRARLPRCPRARRSGHVSAGHEGRAGHGPERAAGTRRREARGPGGWDGA